MLKLTIVGRVSDGLPLAEGPRYVNEEIDNFSTYKQQGEFLLKEISRGALPPSKMTIFLDHHCFNYMVENGICFMALCDAMYPRKLAFHYLQDLHKEFNKFDVGLTERIMTPYSFIKFGNSWVYDNAVYFNYMGIFVIFKRKHGCNFLWDVSHGTTGTADGTIGNVRRKYIDTRTQANLSKINSDDSQEVEIESESFSQIVKRRRRFDMLERMSEAHLHGSPIWCSTGLEIIALKWIPFALVLAVTTILLWTSLHRDELLSTVF